MSHSDDADSRLAAAVADSRVAAALDHVGDRLTRIGQGERTERAATWSRRVVTGSYLYRWLTAEPDPEVIVIDLRETVTVGPFVAMLDRIFAWLDTAAKSSNIVAAARSLLAEFRAAPVRLVGAVVALSSATALLAGVALGTFDVLPTVVLVGLAVAGLAGTQVTASWADFADSRAGQLVVQALEPPTEGTSTSTESDENDPGAPAARNHSE